jgi:hypothetical protein
MLQIFQLVILAVSAGGGFVVLALDSGLFDNRLLPRVWK